MIWLTQDFDLLSVILRALTLSLEALTVGGVLFLLCVATSASAEAEARQTAKRFCGYAALALSLVQTLSAASAAMLMSGSGMPLHEVMTADFFLADIFIIAAGLLLFLTLRLKSRAAACAAPLLAFIILSGSVALSHAASRLDHRVLLVLLTALHHLGTAAWIGAMPFLLITLRRSHDPKRAQALVRRFSNMAVVSVAALLLAGIGMAIFYVGSWNGLYGTSYGLMLLAKIYLLLLILSLGAGNFLLLRSTRGESSPLLIRLQRFSEVEIGLGFTVILVAASLTSQPPAADMQQDMLTRHEIAERIVPKLPSLSTPSFAQLSKRAALKNQLEDTSFTGGSANDAMDQAWSEYNHHWAGIIVLAAGIFALCANLATQRWPRNWLRNWPLLFIGLAVFIVLRADPDTWPLGPRSFWRSFAEAEVLEHRFFAVLIAAFAMFEWAVETGRLRSMRAALVFPSLCAIGGALLMTHSHALGSLKEEALVEMSHTPIALLGATAGWSRWLELRLPGQQNRGLKPILNWIWPICLALAGLILLNYRES